MSERPPSDEEQESGESRALPRARGIRWGRLVLFVSVALLIALAVAIGIIWIERRPIAGHYLKQEFERRHVTARYHLDRIGFRTQEVSNLVVGDPKRPDLIAKHALIEMRLKWDGNFEVYRVVARGVRLRGRLIHGKVSWGQLDKLLPPPSNKPFALPNIVVDIADSSIALATPFGNVGIAAEGSGRLSGGFKGHVAVSSPRLVPGKCEAQSLHTYLAVSVVARHPHGEGPVTLSRFVCPASRFEVLAPRFDAKASFNESFTAVDGSGRMAINELTAGTNALAAFVGDITYKGSLEKVDGRVKLSAQESRMATISAARTRLQGGYHLGIASGNFSMLGDFAADNSALDPSMLASVTQPLAAAAKTPIGPVLSAIGGSIITTTRNFNAAGQIHVVNFPGGGAVRVSSAQIVAPSGARASVFGGSGVTYYWPAYALRIDGNIAMNGGGLPNGRVSISQPAAGAPISGVAQIDPYSAGGQRLAFAPIRFGPGPAGSTSVATVAQLDGAIPGGSVRALKLPIEGEVGRAGGFAFGTRCALVSFDDFRMSTLEFGPTRLPVCPVGRAIISKSSSGPVRTAARIDRPVLNGRIGKSPVHLAAASGQLTDSRFGFDKLAMRLGKPESPIVLDADRLSGTFAGSDLRGNFAGAKGTIGTVPLQLSDASGTWAYRKSALSVESALTVSDRNADVRFYPLRSNDTRFTLAGDFIRASGNLRLPASGAEVMQVNIEHQLSTDSGHANLSVPGLAFGPTFQPDQLTRLTEGVVALVNGTVSGQGRIDWAANGKVTSTGDFSTQNMDLAAPFGPVAGLSTSIHFTDLLNLETAPHQAATIQSINPGILVNDGVVRYQLLPNSRVKIERGEWPFMGGRLILEETVLNFGRPSVKRLTFDLEGFDAKEFVDSLGFQGLNITGKFDGVLPMIFDESGGRIVGGRLDSRPPGGEFTYEGTKPGGLAAGLAFDVLTNLRYRSMIIRLDGDLAGEFATRLSIDGVSMGPSHGILAGLLRSAFSKLPVKLNVNINAPFRALIQTAKAFKDPTQVIAPVMPFPVDSPALKVEVLNTTKDEDQTTQPSGQTAPAATPSTPPGGTK